MIDKDFDLWENEISNCKKIDKTNRVFYKDKLKIEVNNKNKEELPIINDTKNIYYTTNKLNINESLGIDYTSDKKLRTGQYKIDKIIDFHGLFIEDALNLFINTINFAYENNLRCLLFITGKGNNSEKGKETIKDCFKKWVNIDYISNKIIKYTQATNKDGGSGAFYVLMKRRRI